MYFIRKRPEILNIKINKISPIIKDVNIEFQHGDMLKQQKRDNQAAEIFLRFLNTKMHVFLQDSSPAATRRHSSNIHIGALQGRKSDKGNKAI